MRGGGSNTGFTVFASKILTYYLLEIKDQTYVNIFLTLNDQNHKFLKQKEIFNFFPIFFIYFTPFQWSVSMEIPSESVKIGNDARQTTIVPRHINVKVAIKCVVRLLSPFVPNQNVMEIAPVVLEGIGTMRPLVNVKCSNIRDAKGTITTLMALWTANKNAGISLVSVITT